MNKIKALLQKYREQIVYLIFGALTTLVDFGVYWLMERVLHLGTVPSQAIGVAAAILFAYAVNKIWVFRDKATGLRAWMQFLSFVSMRLVSGAFQTAAVWLFVDILHLYDLAVKLVVAVAVVILNYIFSKLIIFRKKGTDKNTSEEDKQ